MNTDETNKRFDFIDLLKFIAIIMIVNSHAKWMYPESLQMLGIGGAWGCSLFFFVSGFTMANMKIEGFVNYAIKKAKRIYPAVWLWLGLSFLITNKIDWVQFIWPSAYWFLCSILVYYALFYFVIKYAKNNIKYISGHLCNCIMLCIRRSFSMDDRFML